MRSKEAPSPFRIDGVKDSIFFFVCGVALCVYSLVNHYAMKCEWKLSPYLFPFLISLFIIVISVFFFLESKTNGEAGKKEETDWRAFLSYLAASFLYCLLMPHLGFIIANILFLASLFIFSGERRWWLVAILSAGVTVVVYVLFHTLLHVMLP